MAEEGKVANNNRGLLEVRPTAIDLFSGVGGLSLGAARAGFDVRLAVELDKHACEYHGRNFPSTKHMQRDVSGLCGDQLLQEAGLVKGQLDALIGGPPCQGFSAIGSKDVSDPRNKLFWHFYRLVKEAQPRVFLAENVPGLLHCRYKDTVIEALSEVKNDYEIYGPQLINASDYGAPTTRTRVFFFGVRKNIFASDLLWLKPLQESFQVNVAHALRGLPKKINPDWQSEEQSWRRVRHKVDTVFFNKVVNCVPAGVGDVSALSCIAKGKVSGFLGTRHTLSVENRFKNLLPGQQDRISKAIRLDKKKFCPTLRAGTGQDKGSYQAIRPIHPDQPRVITPREAARLQGFPDWFQFHPTKWHSFRQIGNSVSPIVAEYAMLKLLAILS